MKIICTPSNGPLAIIVDTNSAEVVREVAMPQDMAKLGRRPFGISRDHTGNWYIARDTAIAQLDKDLVLTKIIPGLPGEDLHQLCYEPVTQELWAVSTGIDSLLAINLQTQSVRRFCLLTDQWIPLDAPARDTTHFNSIAWYGDRFHVVAHRFGQGSSFVRTYDRSMRRISLWQAGTSAHNVLEYNNQILLLDSQGGHILGNQGLKVKVCEAGFYTRGMVVSPGGMAVVAVFTFGERETRTKGDAFIRKFNLETGKQTGEIVLKNVGNIQDLKWWNFA